MSKQLPLGLQLVTPTRLQDYIAGENAPLLEAIRLQTEVSGEPLIYICGPSGSGRTHLLMGQCTALQEQGKQVAYLPAAQHADFAPEMLNGLADMDLLAIDDVDALAGMDNWETALFNLFNQARDAGCRLLFASQDTAANTAFALPDLQSRLGWGLTHRLRPLSDEQRQQLLVNLAKRKGLEMPSEVARYLVERYARDTDSMVKVIEQLDTASLAQQRRLSIPFVRDQLS